MTLKELASDVRCGGRAAAFTAMTGYTLLRYEIESRNASDDEKERLIREAMIRFGSVLCPAYGIETICDGLDDGAKARGTGENGLGRLFVCNHRSGLDILVTLRHIEGKHLSRADLATWPVIGTIARRAGLLFVDRDNKRSAAKSIQTMIQTIEKGISVMIFPEGTTYAGDEVRAFKPGAFAVARRTGAEVVPLGLAYGRDSVSYDDESFLAHMRKAAGAPKTRVGLVQGPAIKLTKGVDSQALSNEAHARVQAAVGRAREIVDHR